MVRSRPLRSVAGLAAVLAGVLVAGLLPVVGLRAGASPSRLAPASAAVLAAVQCAPAPPVSSGTDSWVAPGEGRFLIDDFESVSWPTPGTWVLVTDLTGAADGAFQWAPSHCRAAGGQAALWATGGGADGRQLACGAGYPPNQQTSAVLALDFSALHSVASLDLVFDVWADAGPNEGLFVNYLEFDGTGAVTQRHSVYSATGRSTDWSRGVRLDLTRLRDPLDPAWRFDLRGRTGYLELLFLSVDGKPGGEGIFVDNLAIESVPRPPIVVTSQAPTVTPEPSDNTTGCTTEADCRTLIVEAFDDFRCDGVYRPGRDYPLRGPARVDVVAGTTQLGARLGSSGMLYFRVPMATGAEVRLTAASSYALCPNSPNPRQVRLADFGRRNFTRLTFGLYSR